MCINWIYIYIRILPPPKKKSPAYISLFHDFHVISMSCMGSFCLHISHPSGWLRGFVPTLLPLPRWWKTTLSLDPYQMKNGRKISGQDVPKDATRCPAWSACPVAISPKVVAWGLASASWQQLLTSPKKIKKALIMIFMIDPYQSNQMHQIHGCLWHELLQCFLREPWRPDHTITSEGNPKLDLVKREASFQSFVLLHWELKLLEQFWASIHSPNKDTSWKFITQFSRDLHQVAVLVYLASLPLGLRVVAPQGKSRLTSLGLGRAYSS